LIACGERRLFVDLGAEPVTIAAEDRTMDQLDRYVAVGIPRSAIVLGFQPAEMRPLTSYGVG
jgi:hypothetical protein